MAVISTYRATISMRDSRGISTDWSARVSDADAQEWLDAADATARGLTKVGLLLNAVPQLSGCFAYKRSVVLEDFTDNVTQPAADANIYNFDKLNVSYQAGTVRRTITIPGRDPDDYNVASDGVTVIITGADATAKVTNFITQFEDTYVDINGYSPVVVEIKVVT